MFILLLTYVLCGFAHACDLFYIVYSCFNDCIMCIIYIMTMTLMYINVEINMNVHKLYMLLICFDAIHYVRRPIMDAK